MRRNRLLTAASAIATGIRTMHVTAMLGFGVRGTDIRYDVPLTLVGLVVAMLFVCAGVFAVGRHPGRVQALLIGGLTTGFGVAGMHYPGMATVRPHGEVSHDPVRVALSVSARRVHRSPRAAPVQAIAYDSTGVSHPRVAWSRGPMTPGRQGAQAHEGGAFRKRRELTRRWRGATASRSNGRGVGGSGEGSCGA